MEEKMVRWNTGSEQQRWSSTLFTSFMSLDLFNQLFLNCFISPGSYWAKQEKEAAVTPTFPHWLGVKLARDFRISMIGKAETSVLQSEENFPATQLLPLLKQEVTLMLYFHWCSCWSSCTNRISWFLICCKVTFPSAVKQRWMWADQAVLCGDGEAPHVFRHMKSSSSIQRARCGNLGSVGYFRHPCPWQCPKKCQRSHISPTRWNTSSNLIWSRAQIQQKSRSEQTKRDRKGWISVTSQGWAEERCSAGPGWGYQ